MVTVMKMMETMIGKFTSQLSEINQNLKFENKSFGMMALKGNFLQHQTGGCFKGENIRKKVIKI